ncbi:hypothetical protein MKL26_00270 [Streptococcus suis]|nr:hypothetical protein [Streptococcus suis]
MLTDIQNNRLSDKSYWVELKRNDVDYHPIENMIYNYDDDNPSLGQFQVLQVEDNHANGMQAMAVAPVVNGVVDYNYITIAYAGTNFGDWKDRQTDLNSVIGG